MKNWRQNLIEPTKPKRLKSSEPIIQITITVVVAAFPPSLEEIVIA